MEILNDEEILRCEKCGETYNQKEEYDFVICSVCKHIKSITNENFK